MVLQGPKKPDPFMSYTMCKPVDVERGLCIYKVFEVCVLAPSPSFIEGSHCINTIKIALNYQTVKDIEDYYD